jgi:hypothetical protein
VASSSDVSSQDATTSTSSNSFEIEILNHFYVRNMSVNRKENPSLKDFKMVQRARNVIEFVSKRAEEMDASR